MVNHEPKARGLSILIWILIWIVRNHGTSTSECSTTEPWRRCRTPPASTAIICPAMKPWLRLPGVPNIVGKQKVAKFDIRSWKTEFWDRPISLPVCQDSVEWCSRVETRQDQWWKTTLLEPSGQFPWIAWDPCRVTTASEPLGAVDCIWGSFRRSMMPKAYNQPENMQKTCSPLLRITGFCANRTDALQISNFFVSATLFNQQDTNRKQHIQVDLL